MRRPRPCHSVCMPGQQRCRVGDGQLGFQRLEIRGVHQQAGMVPGGQPAAVETSEIALAIQEFHASAHDIYAVFAARQIVRQRDEQTVSGLFVLHRISIVRNARVDELHDVARFVSAARKLDSFVGVTVVETFQFRDVRYGKRPFRGGGVVGARRRFPCKTFLRSAEISRAAAEIYF